MGYTNSTTNYHLPQFIGTDKPSWLGDVNSAMSAIDTQMKVNADDIDSLETRMTATETVANSASTAATNAGTAATNAQSTADSAATAASNAASAASNAQTTANAAQTAASTADGKAVSAQSTATSALTKANANEVAIGNFNLTSFESPSTITTNYGSITSENIQVAKNSDGSLGKIYGNIKIQNITSATSVAVKATIQTSLRPTSQFTIVNAGIYKTTDSSYNQVFGTVDLTVKTTGEIETSTFNTSSANISNDIHLWPCLYWIKDFGDTPTPPEN